VYLEASARSAFLSSLQGGRQSEERAMQGGARACEHEVEETRACEHEVEENCVQGRVGPRSQARRPPSLTAFACPP